MLQSPNANQRVAGLQDMPNVWIKPPPLPIGGIKQLWCVVFSGCAPSAHAFCSDIRFTSESYLAYRTWLYPVIMTSDAELIHTAGLDSLVRSHVLPPSNSVAFSCGDQDRSC